MIGFMSVRLASDSAEELGATLDKLRTTCQVVPLKRKNLVFVPPTLIARSSFVHGP